MRTLIVSALCVILLFLLQACVTSTNQDANANQKEVIVASNEEVTLTQGESAVLNALANNELFTFLGKSFDQDYAEEIYQLQKANYDKFQNPNWDEEVENSYIVLNLMITESILLEPYFSKSLVFNYNSVIKNGLFCIIPRNPYTEADVKSVLDYSPGDLLLAANESGLIFFYHAGDKDDAYDPTRTDHSKLTYHKLVRQDELLTDGRTLYMFHKFEDDDLSGL